MLKIENLVKTFGKGTINELEQLTVSTFTAERGISLQ